MTTDETIFVRPGRLHYFVREVVKRLRVPAPDASKVADILVAADLAGMETEGVARLGYHVERVSSGLINPRPRIKTVQQAPSVATLDGDNGLGPVVATAAMELALEKAARYGVAAVAVRRSNDFGMAGYYARLALSRQMIGLATSNTSPMVVPVHGTRSMYGTNPVAIAAPAAEGNAPFVLDFTTSVVSKGKIEEARRRRDSIPEGWALDRSGQPTTDPEAALEALRLLPLGTRLSTGAHKGYGLGLIVDILCGVLSGGSFGLELSGAEGYHPGTANICHFFAALRINAFGPYRSFRNRIDEFLTRLISSPAREGPRVYYPGEPEHEVEREKRAVGIPLPPYVARDLERTAHGLDLHEAWEHMLADRK